MSGRRRQAPVRGSRRGNRNPGAVQRTERSCSKRHGARGSLVGHLTLPTVTLTVAGAVAGEASNLAMATSDAVVRCQATEAPAAHPPLESQGTVLASSRRRQGRRAPRATPVPNLLPSQLIAHNLVCRPRQHQWLEAALNLIGRQWQHLWLEVGRKPNRRRRRPGPHGHLQHHRIQPSHGHLPQLGHGQLLRAKQGAEVADDHGSEQRTRRIWGEWGPAGGKTGRRGRRGRRGGGHAGLLAGGRGEPERRGGRRAGLPVKRGLNDERGIEGRGGG